MITTTDIAKTLCKASLFDERNCPYCIKGECQEIMWKTFLKEALAVYMLYEKDKLKNIRLPGLGG